MIGPWCCHAANCPRWRRLLHRGLLQPVCCRVGSAGLTTIPLCCSRLAGIKAVLCISGIIAGGRLVVRPLYRRISALKNSDVFAATTLLVVLGTSVLTQAAGLSLALGAFLVRLRPQAMAQIRLFFCHLSRQSCEQFATLTPVSA